MHIIAGLLKHRRLVSPASASVRPTTGLVREAVFDMLGPAVEGARFLDLFAGSGAVGLEALSRGASGVLLVDRLPGAASAIRRNIESLPEEVRGRAQLLKMDCFACAKILRGRGLVFDMIFIDPPYYRKEPLCERVGALAGDLARAGVLAPDGVLVGQCEAGSGVFDGAPAPLHVVRRKKYGRTEIVFLRTAGTEMQP